MNYGLQLLIMHRYQFIDHNMFTRQMWDVNRGKRCVKNIENRPSANCEMNERMEEKSKHLRKILEK